MLTGYVEKILKARVYDVAIETPLDLMPRLSKRLNNQILIKREDLQSVFSFKLRGAYNRMSHLTDAERKQGVVAASAGNHAQGVALAASKMGISAIIVMPITTPPIKVEAVRMLGADITLHGNSYDEAFDYAKQVSADEGRVFIHPYDDPLVIAGQGTIAMEIMRQHPDPVYAVFIPVGGGGLLGGMAAYIKAIWPEIKIIAVEPADAASLKAALDAGERVKLDQVGLFADGTAVRQVGEEPFRIAQKTVDHVVTVETDEICAAIMDVFDDTRSIAEPSGALSIAGAKKYIQQNGLYDKTMVVINSGANMNFDRLRHVAERAEIGERREVLFAATIDEQPGSFQRFCKTLAERGITEFNYRYADKQQAQVFVGVRMSGREEERQILFENLTQAGYQWIDFSDNEMAKLHVRYMVGGHAPQAENERLIRFEFPERPGALLRFLTHIGQRWNISLFHYRNHGAAYGRVLVGIQVAPEFNEEFQAFLDNLGYVHWLETDNPAYDLFLK
ncbi:MULTISPECIES: threonine ammonia-lyase, biosynthetic [unclassified Methylophaga]|jgi:threonine dehydratase|uniref:threonine ammonia-lyase, biosynthetic n=1 Tax=unclassified Methylophaga TaxID=2629249 RepID=UPI000C6B4CC0|nr:MULTISPECIES: threonine ammonia-lyase, biosynthetic [unclassified Methylophaga]MAL49392.1 threonine ammonia-lyase, biosynthetic [Methylophaga sp.]MAP26279.1 threonine ammonia-lyase, biosynthetic [Methylophaga sp.]MBP24668.1 threonine ammonia-lyase, biosynthetic [Methylophaga sp.]HCN99271.1 threonine ammonia-lyase, biosynthetic [Methylophaga sp.]|tara:strand:- start:188 stop:1702 length:1515 start_codon:yes stop_codon:yes gene_type:complete